MSIFQKVIDDNQTKGAGSDYFVSTTISFVDLASIKKIGDIPSLSKNSYFDDILASLFMDSKKIKNLVKKIKKSGNINISNSD
jgi:hypothetical protein